MVNSTWFMYALISFATALDVAPQTPHRRMVSNEYSSQGGTILLGTATSCSWWWIARGNGKNYGSFNLLPHVEPSACLILNCAFHVERVAGRGLEDSNIEVSPSSERSEKPAARKHGRIEAQPAREPQLRVGDAAPAF